MYSLLNMLAMKVRMANADATGNRLNALEIWLGYFLIAVRTTIFLLELPTRLKRYKNVKTKELFFIPCSFFCFCYWRALS